MGVLDSNFGLFEDGQLLGLAWIDAAHFTDHVTEKMQKQRTHQQTSTFRVRSTWLETPVNWLRISGDQTGHSSSGHPGKPRCRW